MREMNKVILFVLLSLFSYLALAEVPKPSKLNLFKDAVEAVEAAGDAVISLTDAIKHLVVTGSGGYDYVAAARERNRLKDLSARSTNLVSLKQAVVVRNIDEYLEKPNPSNADWDNIKFGVQSVINDVKVLLTDIREERSDFVLEEAYAKLGNTLQQRSIVLDKIAALPKPSNPEELEQLQQINLQYKRLIAAFQEAVKQLNIYIKQSQNA
jgi:hypothetical protein